MESNQIIVILVRDKVSNRIMGKFKSWPEVWAFQRHYLHPIIVEIRTK